MTWFSQVNREFHRRQTSFAYKSIWDRLHLDPILLLGIICLVGFGFVVLYSAADQEFAKLMRQVVRLGLAFFTLLIFAQIPPRKYRAWTPWLYLIGMVLLIAVLLIGTIGKGAQRWLNLGIFRFQPSEMMKLVVPMMVAWYLSNKALPPKGMTLFGALLLLLVPGLLIVKQPDLGTAIMIMGTGAAVLVYAGLSWRFIASVSAIIAVSAPVIWHFMHAYQKQRVLTFLNPENDPFGAGYHIIQSKIALGSGGLFGKGFLHGSQTQLQFLPEHATDFIFAVVGEEMGLLGCLLVLALILFITYRSLHIAIQSDDCYCRLLAGSLGISFFLAAFVNIGMVTGLLPVVGLPLPLVSYGGTAMVSHMACFGVIMAIHTHRKFTP